MIRRIVSAIRRRLARHVSRLAFAAPAPLRRLLPTDPGRDYHAVWVDVGGAAYRRGVYERQRVGGEKPLQDNPTVAEIRAILQADQAHSVLEVGCGWGRLISQLQDAFQVTGCDVSEEMVRLCPPGLDIFLCDVAREDQAWMSANAARWDTVFTRDVMLYITTPDQIATVMNAMLMVCRARIHIWEWPEVCDTMQAICGNQRFVYHPIQHKAE